MPPLSLSIIGVEPLDEFIREVADWVQHMVSTRQERDGTVEVEAKIGMLKDANGQRLNLPVTTETSACCFIPVSLSQVSDCIRSIAHSVQECPLRVEYVSCMFKLAETTNTLITNRNRHNISIITPCLTSSRWTLRRRDTHHRQ